MKEYVEEHIIWRADRIVRMVEEGEVNPLSAYIALQRTAQHFDKCRKMLLDHAIDAREKIPEKRWTQEGYEVSVVSRRTYSYPADSELERLSTLIKARQKAMQESAVMASKHGHLLVDDNGEEIPAAEIKQTTTIALRNA